MLFLRFIRAVSRQVLRCAHGRMIAFLLVDMFPSWSGHHGIFKPSRMFSLTTPAAAAAERGLPIRIPLTHARASDQLAALPMQASLATV